MLVFLLTAVLAQMMAPPPPARVVVLVSEPETEALAAANARLALELRSAGYELPPLVPVPSGADFAWEAAARLAAIDAPWAVVALHAGPAHTSADVWFLLGASPGVQGWSSSTPRAADPRGALLALRVAEILHALRQGQTIEGPPPPPRSPPEARPPSKLVPASGQLWLGAGVLHVRAFQGLGGAWLPAVRASWRPRPAGLGGSLMAFGPGTAAMAKSDAGGASLQSAGALAALSWTSLPWHRLSGEVMAGPGLVRHQVEGEANLGFTARNETHWVPTASAQAGIGATVAAKARLQLDLGCRFEPSLALRIGREVAARTGPLVLHAGLTLHVALW